MEKYERISDEIDKVIVAARKQKVSADTTRKRVMNKLAALFAEMNKTENFTSQLSR